MNDRHQSVPVDGTLLRSARLRLRLGTREFARQAGTTFAVVDRVEKSNALATSATIADARRLAKAAGVTLADLLAEPTSTSATCGDDTQRLAAVLISDNRMTAREDIASAFGWTLDHLDQVANDLDAALVPLGLRVHSSNGAMCLRPRHRESLEAAQAIERRRASRDTMTVTEARLLRQGLLNGGIDTNPTATERPALGHLVNMGVLRPGQPREPLHVVPEEVRGAFKVSASQARPGRRSS